MKRWREREADLENQLKKGSLWAITYGDLMSYLMIFFLILFTTSMSKNTNKKNLENSISSIEKIFGGKANPEQARKSELMQKERTAISQMKASVEDVSSPMVKVLESERKVRLILQSPVLFDLSHADLKPEALPVLKKIVDSLKNLPNDIVVEGHTDNTRFVGKQHYSSNWELSMARAYSVIRFLEENGVDAKRLSGLGYGEHRPVESNDTAEGRGKNRRIEISLIKTE